MPKKNGAAFLMMLFFSFLINVGVGAQSSSASSSVLESRLCQSWKLLRTEQGGKSVKAEQANEFVLIINRDHTVQQGMQPDGLINGVWNVIEKEMMFTITDAVTGTEYPMRIFQLTSNELVLEDISSQPSLFIHYALK